MTPDMRTLGEDLLGAEIVAGKELTEAAGSVLEGLERAGAIWLRQGSWLLEDYGQFWRTAFTRPGDPAVLTTLIESRSRHIGIGFHELADLIEREWTPLVRMSSDYVGTVVRRKQNRP